MKLLAIDTCFDACSAAIAVDGEIAWSERRLIGKGHSEVLPVMVAQAFADTGLSAHDLDRVGVVIGPGAFAGVRVGLAFARGLVLGTKARAIGVTSTLALAESVKFSGVLGVAFDARRGQVYAAAYDQSLAELIAPFVASPVVAAARLGALSTDGLTLAGSGAALVAPHVSSAHSSGEDTLIDPAALARLCEAAPSTDASPAPLYLRPPDAAPSSGSLFSEICDA